MPSFLLWLLWIGGGSALFIGLLCVFSGDFDFADLAPWGTLWLLLSLLSIVWYCGASTYVHSLPPRKVTRIGIIETSILPGGARVSIVKTETGILNLSDTYHKLLPEGAIYSSWEAPCWGHGIYFTGASGGHAWDLPESQR